MHLGWCQLPAEPDTFFRNLAIVTAIANRELLIDHLMVSNLINTFVFMAVECHVDRQVQN